MKKNEIPTPHPDHQQASATIAAALGTLSFPIDKKKAISKVGDWKVPYATDQKVPLGQILAAVPHEEFTDVTQATAAVDAHWGRIAESLQGLAATEQAERGQKKRR